MCGSIACPFQIRPSFEAGDFESAEFDAGFKAGTVAGADWIVESEFPTRSRETDDSDSGSLLLESPFVCSGSTDIPSCTGAVDL
jgi:hypothetical protein